MKESKETRLVITTGTTSLDTVLKTNRPVILRLGGSPETIKRIPDFFLLARHSGDVRFAWRNGVGPYMVHYHDDTQNNPNCGTRRNLPSRLSGATEIFLIRKWDSVHLDLKSKTV